ncbi:atherin-like [Zonotrichia leucophrys gambelii]|uniref:atherin-like n=1 Tax=Zonotrichia leucophrys gambelii TaxID=257770 RepID=UPI003140311C
MLPHRPPGARRLRCRSSLPPSAAGRPRRGGGSGGAGAGRAAGGAAGGGERGLARSFPRRGGRGPVTPQGRTLPRVPPPSLCSSSPQGHPGTPAVTVAPPRSQMSRWSHSCLREETKSLRSRPPAHVGFESEMGGASPKPQVGAVRPRLQRGPATLHRSALKRAIIRTAARGHASQRQRTTHKMRRRAKGRKGFHLAFVPSLADAVALRAVGAAARAVPAPPLRAVCVAARAVPVPPLRAVGAAAWAVPVPAAALPAERGRPLPAAAAAAAPAAAGLRPAACAISDPPNNRVNI